MKPLPGFIYQGMISYIGSFPVLLHMAPRVADPYELGNERHGFIYEYSFMLWVHIRGHIYRLARHEVCTAHVC